MSAIITKEQFDELLRRVGENVKNPNFSWENLYQIDQPFAYVPRTKKNQYLRLGDLPKSLLSKIPSTFVDESNLDYYNPQLLKCFIDFIVHIDSDFIEEPKLIGKKVVFYERVTRTSIEHTLVSFFETKCIDYYSYISRDSQKWIHQAFDLFETNNSYEMRLFCVEDLKSESYQFTLINGNKNNTLLLSYENCEMTACIGHQSFRFKKHHVESQMAWFGSEVTDVMSQIKNILNDDNIDKLSSILSTVNETVEKRDEITESITSRITSMFEKTSKDVVKKMSIALCIIGLFISLRDKSYSIAAISMAILAYAHKDEMSVFLKKYTIFQRLSDLVSKFSSENIDAGERIAAQVGLTSYVPEIATAMSLFVVGKESKTGNIFTGDTLRLFGTAKMAIQNIVNLVLTVIESIIYNAGYGDKYERVFMLTQNSDPVYRDFTTKVFEIDDNYREKKLTFTYDNYSLIKETLSEGQRLMRDLPKTTATQGLVSTMHSALQRLTTYAKAFMDSGFMTEGLRQEPVAILLQGGPGTLKTQTMQHLAHALCSAVVEDSKRAAFETTPERFIYNRMIESEYWDKYNSDKIVCMFDDFLQIRDVAGGGDSEVFNIIRAVNEQNYDLHMADLADKGNTSFQCKFVICTSNSEKLDVQSIHDKGALLRRFKYTYIPVPRDEFKKLDGRVHLMKQKVDMTKLPTGELGISSTNPDEVLDFHQIDLNTGKTTGVIHTFEEVVINMIDSYKFNKMCYDQKLIELKKQRTKYSGFAARAEMAFWKSEEKFYDAIEYDDSLVMSYFDDLLSGIDVELTKFLMTRLQRLSSSDLVKFKTRFSKLIESVDYYKTDMRMNDIIGALLSNYTVRDQIFNFNIPISDIVMVLKSDAEFASYIWVTCDDLPERGMLESLRDRFNNGISAIKDKMSLDSEYLEFVNWKNALLAATTLASIVAVFYSFKTSVENEDLKDLIRRPEEAEGDYKLRQPKRKAPRKDLKTLRKALVQSQISLVADKQGEQIVEKILRHNVFEFSSRRDSNSEWVKLGFVTFLKGTIAIMPRHFIDALAYRLEEEPETIENAEFRLRGTTNSNDGQRVIMLSISDIMYDLQETPVLKDQDLILVNLPDVQPRRDIMKYIMTERDVQSLGRKPVCILGKTGSIMSISQVHGKTMERVLVNDIDLEPYEIKTTMAYNVATSKGDCGTILGVLSPALPNRKICGIHVAGSPHQNMGYSSIFTYEMIEECLELFDAEHKISCNPDDTQSQFGERLVGDGRFGAFRDAPVAPSIATKTVIVPSRIQGLIAPPFMKPAKLRAERVNGESRDPWEYAMSNYKMDTPILKKDVINDATEQYQDFLFNASTHDEDKRLYTFEEAVIGIPGTEFDSINRRTSPGYPDVVSKPRDFKGKGKELYFGSEDDFNLDGDYCILLKQRVENAIEKASNGIRSEYIFMDCLKDELRPAEKADDFKTRLISASSLELLILYRMYFGAYMHWYKRNRVNNQSAIGVNVYSQEWDMIAKKLQKFSPGDCKNVGAGDYSKFDGTEKPYIHKKILEVINNWYDDGEDNALIRKVLWLELTNSIHIQGKCIYEWYTSLPSGHPLTAIVNTMYNGIAFRYCWNRAFSHDNDLRQRFNDFCYLIAMGDDNVFSVEGRYSNVFTEVTVGKYMKELGLVYTSETKDAVNVEMRHLHDVEFLKRRWRKCNLVGRYVAPHQIEREIEILNWSKRGARADEICIDNVDSVLRELSLHGSEVYKTWSKKIATVSHQQLGYYPKTMSFSRNLELVTNQEMYC